MRFGARRRPKPARGSAEADKTMRGFLQRLLDPLEADRLEGGGFSGYTSYDGAAGPNQRFLVIRLRASLKEENFRACRTPAQEKVFCMYAVIVPHFRYDRRNDGWVVRSMIGANR